MPEETLRAVRRVFHFPILGRLWKYIVAVAVYSSLVVAFGRGIILADPNTPTSHVGELVMVGIIFGWLLSFRTQTSYARWWEGRSLWGQLVNDTRNLMLKAAAYIPDPAERAKLGATLLRFAETLRDRLRAPRNAPGPHLPMEAAGEVFRLIRGWHESGRIDGFMFLAFDQHAQELMNVCGGCEKIRATPLVSSYRGLLRKGIAGYLLLLPWLINDEAGWETVPICVLVTYAVVGLELIATGIEDPFGYDGDDLPLEDVVQTIRQAVGSEP